jgi:hypothetical protein
MTGPSDPFWRRWLGREAARLAADRVDRGVVLGAALLWPYALVLALWTVAASVAAALLPLPYVAYWGVPAAWLLLAAVGYAFRERLVWRPLRDRCVRFVAAGMGDEAIGSEHELRDALARDRILAVLRLARAATS